MTLISLLLILLYTGSTDFTRGMHGYSIGCETNRFLRVCEKKGVREVPFGVYGEPSDGLPSVTLPRRLQNETAH